VLHALLISSSLTRSFCFARSTSYEARHYAVLSNLPSLHLSSDQLFSSAPCSQTPSVYVNYANIITFCNHFQYFSRVYSSCWSPLHKCCGVLSETILVPRVSTTVRVKNDFFWDVMSCNRVGVNWLFGVTHYLRFNGRRTAQARSECSLLPSLFDSADGRGTFPRKFVELLPGHTASHPTRKYSSDID
jgi:hypothetical protein